MLPRTSRLLILFLSAAATLSPLPSRTLAAPDNLITTLDQAANALAANDLDRATTLYTHAWRMRNNWECRNHSEQELSGTNLNIAAAGSDALKFRRAITDMGRLAKLHPRAHDEFSHLRYESEQHVLAQPTDENAISDLLALNFSLGIPDHNILIFDQLRTLQECREIIDRHLFAFEPLLVKSHRWADLGRLYENPLEFVAYEARCMEVSRQHDEELIAEGNAPIDARRMHLRRIGIMYASLLAACRENEAQQVAEYIIKTDPDPQVRIALIEAAIEAGECRNIHLIWCASVIEEGIPTQTLIEQIKSNFVNKM